MKNKNLISKYVMRAVAVAAFVLAFVLPLAVLAADAAFPIPEGDVAAILLNLATNYKTLGVVGIASVLTLVSVQAIKAFAKEEWKYKRLLTLCVSVIYSILSGFLVPGSNWASVVVTVFLTSGGASALYEALKGAGVIKKAS